MTGEEGEAGKVASWRTTGMIDDRLTWRWSFLLGLSMAGCIAMRKDYGRIYQHSLVLCYFSVRTWQACIAGDT